MMRRVSSILIAVSIAACGNSPAHVDADIDAGIDAVRVDAPGPPACNPFDQVECVAFGQRCTYTHNAEETFDASALRCTDEVGTVPEGGSCTSVVGGFDDCVARTVCRVDTCVGLCSFGNIDCTAGFCPANEQVCFAGCDPTAPDCPTGMQCTLPVFPDAENPGCAPVGARTEGTLCGYPEDCGPGLACRGEDAPNARCVPICIVGGPSCVSGTCVPRHAGDGYGFCL